MKINVQKVHENATLPTYANPGDGGADLYAVEDFYISPESVVSVGTGVAVEIPPGHAGFILPRSGLGLKHGIGVVNAPGLVDSGYRGELRISLINHSGMAGYHGKAGDRIAQLVVQKVEQPEFVEAKALGESVRGKSGFGSTGR